MSERVKGIEIAVRQGRMKRLAEPILRGLYPVPYMQISKSPSVNELVPGFRIKAIYDERTAVLQDDVFETGRKYIDGIHI